MCCKLYFLVLLHLKKKKKKNVLPANNAAHVFTQTIARLACFSKIVYLNMTDIFCVDTKICHKVLHHICSTSNNIHAALPQQCSGPITTKLNLILKGAHNMVINKKMPSIKDQEVLMMKLAHSWLVEHDPQSIPHFGKSLPSILQNLVEVILEMLGQLCVSQKPHDLLLPLFFVCSQYILLSYLFFFF